MPRVSAKQPSVEQLDTLTRDMRVNADRCMFQAEREDAARIATLSDQLADLVRHWRQQHG